MLVKISPELKKYFTYEMPEEQMKDMAALAEKTDLGKTITTINLLLEAQNKIASFILPQLPLEIAIIKATQKFPAMHSERRTVDSEQKPQTNNSAYQETETDLKPIPRNSVSPEKNIPNQTIKIDSKEYKEDNDATIEPDNNPPEDNNPEIDLYAVKSNWSRLLTDIRPHNHSISALLSNCQPVSAQGGKITLATPYEFYAERLRDPKNKLTVEEVLGKILGCRLILSVAVDKTIQPQKSAAEEEKPGEQNSLLDSALEIMGGKVVEE